MAEEYVSVGLGETRGPVTRVGGDLFVVDMRGVSADWFTSPLLIEHPTCATIGQARQRDLLILLENFILRKESHNG